MRLLLVTFAVVALAACANGAQTSIPTCTTMAACMAHDGQRVHVVGIYKAWDPLPVRAQNHPPPRQVMVVLGPEQEGLFLGAWGHEGHMRPLEEIGRFDGKKVRVTGKLLREMPPHPTDPPEAASLDGPCIHPVESIALAE